MKEIAVFSGGGTRGMFQVGAWEYLSNTEKYNPDVFAGSSVGSLNAAFLAANRFQMLKNLWFLSGGNSRLLFASDFLNTDANFRITAKGLLRTLRHFFTSEKIGGIVQMEGIAKLLKVVSRKELKERGKELIINFASLHTGKNFSYHLDDFPTDSSLADAIIASASFPGIFPSRPVATYNDFHPAGADAGIARGGILGAAVDYAKSLDEPVRFTIFLTTAPDSPTWADYTAIEKNLSRSLEIALNTISSYELTLFRERNNLPGYTSFEYRIIQPDPEFLSGYMDFAPSTLNRLFEHGQQQAAAAKWHVL